MTMQRLKEEIHCAWKKHALKLIGVWLCMGLGCCPFRLVLLKQECWSLGIIAATGVFAWSRGARGVVAFGVREEGLELFFFVLFFLPLPLFFFSTPMAPLNSCFPKLFLEIPPEMCFFFFSSQNRHPKRKEFFSFLLAVTKLVPLLLFFVQAHKR